MIIFPAKTFDFGFLYCTGMLLFALVIGYRSGTFFVVTSPTRITDNLTSVFIHVTCPLLRFVFELFLNSETDDI